MNNQSAAAPRRRTVLAAAAWTAPALALAAAAPLAAASTNVRVAVVETTFFWGRNLNLELIYTNVPANVTPSSWFVTPIDPPSVTMVSFGSSSPTHVLFGIEEYVENSFTGTITTVFSDGSTATSEPFTALAM